MKFGYETIIWGREIDDLDTVLDIIAGAGYQGVEFSQWPGRLPPIQDLLKMLEDRQLALIGFSGGTLYERIKYCGNYRPEHLIVFDWSELAEKATADGFKFALHPHLHKPKHRIEEVFDLLKKHDKLLFLPDTALLTIAGDDPVEAIQRAFQLGKGRLVGVHLKDWSPEYGHAAHRYAYGFTELGTGIIELEAVLRELQQSHFTGWMIVEQDNTRKDIPTSVSESAQWLANKGFSVVPRKASALSSPKPRIPAKRPTTFSADDEARFLKAISRASTMELNACYDQIAASFSELVPDSLVMVMMCNPINNVVSLLSLANGISTQYDEYSHAQRTANLLTDGHYAAALGKLTLEFEKTLSGVAVERQTTTSFDLTTPHPGAEYGYPSANLGYSKLCEQLGLTRMVGIPVLGISNPRHARLIVNIFSPANDRLAHQDELEYLFYLSQYAGIAADSALDEICSFAAASVNILAGPSTTTNGFLEKIRDLILELVECEAISIFLINDIDTKLELATSTTNADWRVPENEQFYAKGEGLTGQVWDRREALLTTDTNQEPGHSGKSAERVITERKACLMAPLVNSRNEVVGVVRCMNKHESRPQDLRMFTNDDVAILEAIGQAAVPHLQILLSEEWRARALGRMIHEFKTPLVAIRGAADLMDAEFEKRRTSAVEFFDHDYLEDIWAWSDIMRRLLGNADVFRYPSLEIPLQPQPTLLLKHVVAPAVNQVQILLRNRGFSQNSIRYGSFTVIPDLWIDRSQFQQVIFNLLSNAIKYCYHDAKSFQVAIVGEIEAGDFVVRFRDWGPGISREMREAIFREGIRDTNAIKDNVAGQGLGLWVVRKIVEAHGGEVLVTKLRQPTEISIYLPHSLASRPPRS